MTRQPADDLLLAALREIPRETASDGFTSSVLARIDEPESPGASFLPLKLLASAAVTLILFAIISMAVDRRLERRKAAEIAFQAEQLRREHLRLLTDVAELRVRAVEAAPILYLGSSEELDLVLDLRPALAASAGSEPTPQIVPASTEAY